MLGMEAMQIFFLVLIAGESFQSEDDDEKHAEVVTCFVRSLND